jgi:toxin ParE1/3/4
MSVGKRQQARHDLIEIADHFDQVDPALADRFLEAAERTFAILESMSRMGAPFPLVESRLRGMRHHPIQSFPNHLVFYLPTPVGIEVVRVLHGARNVKHVLEGQP